MEGRSCQGSFLRTMRAHTFTGAAPTCLGIPRKTLEHVGAFLPKQQGQGVGDDAPGTLRQGRGERGFTVAFGVDSFSVQ